jgi:PPOX class probable FMN-dependent enzyme
MRPRFYSVPKACATVVPLRQTRRMAIDTVVTSVGGLREIYSEPRRPSVEKEVDHLDVHCRDFIAHAPFLTLASATADGTRVDVSPKGGPAGFVHVLDDHRLSIPDMSGNNRLDSLRNIVEGGRVALLFMVPGVEETMRVNGRATVSTDPDVLAATVVAGKRPNACIVVEVSTAFIHCAKALKRSGLWDTDRWPDHSDMATPACMLRDHIGLEMTVEESQARLDESYKATTWEVGGRSAS